MEFKEGQRVRIKKGMFGAEGKTGTVLYKKGGKYAVQTDQAHFGLNMYMEKAKDLEPWHR